MRMDRLELADLVEAVIVNECSRRDAAGVDGGAFPQDEARTRASAGLRIPWFEGREGGDDPAR